jgi:hypothetical protein
MEASRDKAERFTHSDPACAWRLRFFLTAPIIKEKTDGKVAF